jgi:hypothetical protein
VSEASRWLDGFAAAASLAGVRPAEVAEMLPDGINPPAWLTSLESQPSRQARAARLAAQALRLRGAVELARPRAEPARLRPSTPPPAAPLAGKPRQS